jgi:hypothetical protein
VVLRRNLTLQAAASDLRPDPRTRIRRFPVAALVGVLATAFSIYSALHPIDFHLYHVVARQVLQGDYTFYEAGVDPVTGQPAVPGFRYMPVVAFLFVPLGWLSVETAAFLFFWVKAGCLVLVALVVRRLMAA